LAKQPDLAQARLAEDGRFGAEQRGNTCFFGLHRWGGPVRQFRLTTPRHGDERQRRRDDELPCLHGFILWAKPPIRDRNANVANPVRTPVGHTRVI
jgi:hypothetical protein